MIRPFSIGLRLLGMLALLQRRAESHGPSLWKHFENNNDESSMNENAVQEENHFRYKDEVNENDNYTFVNVSSCIMFFVGQMDLVLLTNQTGFNGSDSAEELILPLNGKHFDSAKSSCRNQSNTARIVLSLPASSSQHPVLSIKTLQISFLFKRSVTCPQVPSDWLLCEAALNVDLQPTNHNRSSLPALHFSTNDSARPMCSSTAIGAGEGVSFACDSPSTFWIQSTAVENNATKTISNLNCQDSAHTATRPTLGLRLRQLQVQPFNTTSDHFNKPKLCVGLEQMHANYNGTWIAICTVAIVLATCVYAFVKVVQVFICWGRTQIAKKKSSAHQHQVALHRKTTVANGKAPPTGRKATNGIQLNVLAPTPRAREPVELTSVTVQVSHDHENGTVNNNNNNDTARRVGDKRGSFLRGATIAVG